MSKRQTVKQSKRTRRTFSDEFKIRAVKMVTEQGCGLEYVVSDDERIR